MDKLSSSYKINVVRITEQSRLEGTSAGPYSQEPLRAGSASNLYLVAQGLILVSYEDLQAQILNSFSVELYSLWLFSSRLGDS